jgi:hypothetical protein
MLFATEILEYQTSVVPAAESIKNMKMLSKIKSLLPLFLTMIVLAGTIYIDNIFASQQTSPQTPSVAKSSVPSPLPAPKPIIPASSPGPVRQASNESLNWAGYIANTGTFTAVSGTWTIPEVTDSSGYINADAAWVGIGGVSSRDLIQAGTETIIDPYGGVAYRAFIETLPSYSQEIPLAIKPGDSITAAINQQSPGYWNISVKNNTTDEIYQTLINYSSTLSSAEWIEEMPSFRRGFIPLDNFGSIQFTDASATQNGTAVTLAQAQAQRVDMINFNQQTIAITSDLANDGIGFSVTRTSIQV